MFKPLKKRFNQRFNNVCIEFGTHSTKFFNPNNNIFSEYQSIIKLSKEDSSIISIGSEVTGSKLEKNTEIFRPFRNGAISNYKPAEIFFRYHYARLIKGHNFLHRFFGTNIVLSVHSTNTEVELSALTDIVSSSNVRSVKLVNEGIAAAYSLDINEDESYFICNIGAGATDIIVFYKGEIIVDKTFEFGGENIDKVIAEYLERKYNLNIGTKYAERLKYEITLNRKKNKTMKVLGKDSFKNLPQEVEVNNSEISKTVENELLSLVDRINLVLEEIPVDLIEGIHKNGILLSGGISNINGLAEYLSKVINIKFEKIKNSNQAVTLGLSKIAKDQELINKLEIKDFILL